MRGSWRSIKLGCGTAACAAAITAAGLLPLAAQQERPDLAKMFNKREVMIPARDGVKLHTEIYTPKNAKEPLPILLERTPYGISAEDKGMSNSLYRYADMFADGYVFVFQDRSEERRVGKEWRTLW